MNFQYQSTTHPQAAIREELPSNQPDQPYTTYFFCESCGVQVQDNQNSPNTSTGNPLYNVAPNFNQLIGEPHASSTFYGRNASSPSTYGQNFVNVPDQPVSVFETGSDQVTIMAEPTHSPRLAASRFAAYEISHYIDFVNRQQRLNLPQRHESNEPKLPHSFDDEGINSIFKYNDRCQTIERDSPFSLPLYRLNSNRHTVPILPDLHLTSHLACIEKYRKERHADRNAFDEHTATIKKRLIQAKTARGGAPYLCAGDLTLELACRFDAERLDEWCSARFLDDCILDEMMNGRGNNRNEPKPPSACLEHSFDQWTSLRVGHENLEELLKAALFDQVTLDPFPGNGNTSAPRRKAPLRRNIPDNEPSHVVPSPVDAIIDTQATPNQEENDEFMNDFIWADIFPIPVESFASHCTDEAGAETEARTTTPLRRKAVKSKTEDKDKDKGKGKSRLPAYRVKRRPEKTSLTSMTPRGSALWRSLSTVDLSDVLCDLEPDIVEDVP